MFLFAFNANGGSKNTGRPGQQKGVMIARDGLGWFGRPKYGYKKNNMLKQAFQLYFSTI
jgi:hypothetical protein